MDKISDRLTSVFHIAIADNRPVACSSSDGAIVWSDVFGLGWRLGIAYNHHEWFAKVRLYLDHNHAETEEDQAIVSVSLVASKDEKDAKGVKETLTTITDFGHGPPALLGAWSPNNLSLRPYVWITITANARMSQPVTDPLSATASAVRQSMESGDFVDTKFYVFSAKGPGTTAHRPRAVYANNNSIRLVLPKSSRGAKRVKGLAPTFMVNMTDDSNINPNSVLHEYEYEHDSDLDDEEGMDSDSDIEHHHDPVPGDFQTGSSSRQHIFSPPQGAVDTELPPAYSVNTHRMVLIKGVAYKTWFSYVYFRYTGQVSFLPLKSAKRSSGIQPNDPDQPPSCSPKSMYRLATSLGDDRLNELAFRAIKEGLSKNNIVGEAFSWFTSQYPAIAEYEVDKLYELRKAPEVLTELRLQMKAVSLGDKPWAQDVLIAILDRLNPSEPSS